MIQKDLFGNIVTVADDRLDRSDFKVAIHDLLLGISLEDFVKLITNPVREVVEYLELCKGKNTCKKTSLLFNPHRLSTRATGGRLSIYEGLSTENFLDGLARAMAYRYNESNYHDLMYAALQFGGINNAKYVNEFPPKIARDMCIKFGIGREHKVLDPCAGWGGRMIGISSVCDRYVGFEPSTRTHKGLLELCVFLQKMQKNFTSDVYCLPFEDSTIENDSFDFAITSPPYYDTEQYSDESTNSLNRYHTFDDWCSGFYIPMIQKTMDALKVGRSFVINIGSRIYPLNKVLIENFGEKYEVVRMKGNYMNGGTGGIRNTENEGETFYQIKKT